MPPLKQRSRDSPSNWCATDVSNVMNDLLTITEVGQQKVINKQVNYKFIITAVRFLARKKQI